MASDEFQWCGWRIPQVPRILKLFQSDTILRMRSKPETINNDPHGAGWLIKIKLANPAEVNALMEAAAYEAFYRGKDKRSIRLIYRPNEATESVVILSALRFGQRFA